MKLGVIKTVNNTQRKFGSGLSYEAVFVEYKGDVVPLILTTADIKDAKERGEKNPEDMPIFTDIKPFNWAVAGFVLGLIIGSMIAVF